MKTIFGRVTNIGDEYWEPSTSKPRASPRKKTREPLQRAVVNHQYFG